MSESDLGARAAHEREADLYPYWTEGSWPHGWSRAARQVMGASSGGRGEHGLWTAQTEGVR